MVLDLYNSARETRDNLGTQDENQNLVLVGIFNENIGIEMGATILRLDNVGDSFVLGHSTNGILGTSMLGENNYTQNVVYRVVNPNNVWHEHFRFDLFNDSTNSTSTFDTTNHNVNFDNGEVFLTTDIFKNVQSVQYVTIYVDLNGSKGTTTIGTGGGKTVTLTEGT